MPSLVLERNSYQGQRQLTHISINHQERACAHDYGWKVEHRVHNEIMYELLNRYGPRVPGPISSSKEEEYANLAHQESRKRRSIVRDFRSFVGLHKARSKRGASAETGEDEKMCNEPETLVLADWKHVTENPNHMDMFTKPSIRQRI